MAIDFYFDFASPSGFIAAMQVEALARPVRWHPFLPGAIQRRVFGSPFFIVDGEPFWGSDQIPFLNAAG
jgi:2-hydroxychromene-2-carboxylate isomerase